MHEASKSQQGICWNIFIGSLLQPLSMVVSSADSATGVASLRMLAADVRSADGCQNAAQNYGLPMHNSEQRALLDNVVNRHAAAKERLLLPQLKDGQACCCCRPLLVDVIWITFGGMLL